MVHQMNPEMRQCIDACTECSSICRETVNYCLERGGRLAEPKQLRMLMDCAEMCRTNADFMLRASEAHTETCSVCAELCRRCAEECERMAGGDAMLLRCAVACRRCAEACVKVDKLAAV
jgi:hypothetical protein